MIKGDSRFFLSCLSLLWCIAAQASWIPFINHYGRSDYGDGTYTWRIVSMDKWTFFTNEKGLLVFDGVSWSKYQLNNRSEARGLGVFPESKRVYVGGENEYGYFEINKSGMMDYHCLSETVDRKYRQVGNVWEIYELNGALYLRCDDYILVIAGDNYSLIKTDSKIFASLMMNGIIYVATDQGIRMIAGERLMPVANTEILNNKRINSMFCYQSGMVVTTATDGMYYYDGHDVKPLVTQADMLLKQGVICCAATRGDRIVLGTIHNGLVVINMKTGKVDSYDEKRGLQNNTVLSVAFDQDGSVWAGMDYGIDLVLLEDPFTYLYRSPDSYGIGYSAQFWKGQLYFGTDRGLYVSSFPVTFTNGVANISRVNCPSGSAWYLYNNGEELFCMHDKGVFTVKGNVATKITDIIGAWACCTVDGHPDELLIGTYSGLYIVKKIDGKWVSLGAIEGISEPCRYFRQSGSNQLKVYNRNLGTATIYNLDESLLKVRSQRQVKEQYTGSLASEQDLIYGNWDVTGEVLTLADDQQVFPYNKGFVLFNRQKSKASRNVFIRRMTTTYPADSLIYSANFCNVKSVPQIPYSNNSVRFEYQVPALHVTMDAKYQYRLNGEEWSSLTELTSKEYNNLREGEYTFEVRAKLKNGNVSTDSLTFRILPPWYRSWYAYLIYSLLAAAVLYASYLIESRRVRHKQLMAVAEKSKEVDLMKGEIDKLEKDKMDLDMMHKNQEIANLVISVARKNETLNELKNEIKQVALKVDRNNTTECKRQLLMIMNSIDSNMEGDEVLRRFEEQFDLVNDNFMQKLSQIYPSLNQNERLMCAYLKMDLSTKDIAPLLNMSIRGVETIRYRLRKKMGLERVDNLSEYLSRITS